MSPNTVSWWHLSTEIVTPVQHEIQEIKMKVLRILSDVRLVIAELEVHLGEDVRNSPTLCAVVPGVIGAPDQVVPLGMA